MSTLANSYRFSARKPSLWLAGVLALAFAASTLIAADAAAPPKIDTSFQQMFDLSKSQNKGLVLFVQGQSIAGLVVAYSDEAVELRSQQYERIVVRVDRIDGLAHQ